MSALALDTLAVSKRLKSSGFSEHQAEAIAHEIQDIAAEDHLVTKAHLDDRLEKMELRINNTVKEMQLKIGALIVGLGAFLAAIKFFG